MLVECLGVGPNFRVDCNTSTSPTDPRVWVKVVPSQVALVGEPEHFKVSIERAPTQLQQARIQCPKVFMPSLGRNFNITINVFAIQIKTNPTCSMENCVRASAVGRTVNRSVSLFRSGSFVQAHVAHYETCDCWRIFAPTSGQVRKSPQSAGLKEAAEGKVINSNSKCKFKFKLCFGIQFIN